LFFNIFNISSLVSLLKFILVHLDFIVGKKALSLVVISIIVTYSGGSSNVFSNAF